MKPLRYYVIPRSEIERLTSDYPLDPEYLAKYEANNGDNLGDGTQDIFAPNSRSARQRWHDFSLFEQVEDPNEADFIVCQNWLEMFHNSENQRGVRIILENAIQNFKDRLILFSWNHDHDSATVTDLHWIPDNCVLMDYNTSRPRDTSILLPFWNIVTDVRYKSEPTTFAGFVGYVGRIPVRKALKRAVEYKSGYYWNEDRISEDDWIDRMRSFRFALCPRGGGLSSYRFYEAIQCGAIPVLIGDDAVLPFSDIDYSEFSIRIPERYATNFRDIDELLASVDYEAMRERLRKVRKRFSLLGVQREIHRRVREML